MAGGVVARHGGSGPRNTLSSLSVINSTGMLVVLDPSRATAAHAGPHWDEGGGMDMKSGVLVLQTQFSANLVPVRC